MKYHIKILLIGVLLTDSNRGVENGVRGLDGAIEASLPLHELHQGEGALPGEETEEYDEGEDVED